MITSQVHAGDCDKYSQTWPIYLPCSVKYQTFAISYFIEHFKICQSFQNAHAHSRFETFTKPDIHTREVLSRRLGKWKRHEMTLLPKKMFQNLRKKICYMWWYFFLHRNDDIYWILLQQYYCNLIIQHGCIMRICHKTH